MSGYIEGEDRQQSTLFPEKLDDYVAEDNPIRVIDVLVDDLDISGLGFKNDPKLTGRPGYHPRSMLKLYLYGYLNKIQSSRRLERESQRNVELMWLLGRLAPDFKTVADFRKDNGEAIVLVCREFVMLCRKLDLLSDSLVAIDGSKFKAVNNRDRNFTKAKMKRRLEILDETIARYLEQIASADRKDTQGSRDKTEHLNSKIESLKEEMIRLKKLEVQLHEVPDGQISLTDPDARSMKSRGSGVVGYNVQTAVDSTHHLIVAFDVNNKGSDRGQLFNMASTARDAIGTSELNIVADRGYFSGTEILKCHEAGMTTIIPKTVTSSNRKKGQFDKRDFIYIKKDDEYECPAGERLIWRFRTHERGLDIDKYWSSACTKCRIKSQCTDGVYRRVARWVYENLLDDMQDRLDKEPELMRVRRQTVEHPFGTIKSWMGATHFLTKTKKHVNTEMALHVLAYNMKRLTTIIGVLPLLKAIRA